MNCCICGKQPKFICSCINPSVFICNEHLDLHTSGPGDHVHRISNSKDLFPILFDDLKMIRVQIIANSDLKIKKILEQTRISIKEINNCIENLKKSLDNDQKNLLKMMNELKSLKLVNFEDLQKNTFIEFWKMEYTKEQLDWDKPMLL